MGKDRRQREELHRDYLTAPETKFPYIELSGQRNQQVHARYPAVAGQQSTRRDFSPSLSRFNKFTASNHQVAVQHPFRGDVSFPHPLRSSVKPSFSTCQLTFELTFERGLTRIVRGFESLPLRHTLGIKDFHGS